MAQKKDILKKQVEEAEAEAAADVAYLRTLAGHYSLTDEQISEVLRARIRNRG